MCQIGISKRLITTPVLRATHNKLLNSVGLRNGGQLIDNFGDLLLPKGELTMAKA
jgi:hypothetical protein